MKPIFKNVYEEMKEKEGTYNKMINENDRANQERAEETEIKKIIEKYGVLPFELVNSVKEPLYIDMRGDTLTLNEKLKQKREIDEYFENMPAIIRKSYKDDKELFYQKILSGEFNQLINDGILTEEHAKELKSQLNEKENKINQLQNQLNDLKNNTIKKIEE